MTDSLIVKAIQLYYPDFEAPEETWREWAKCCCPFHGDETPSAAISYEREAFNCMACGVRGDAIAIIKHEEGLKYPAAKQRAAELSLGGNGAVPSRAPRKSSRRVSRWSRSDP